MKKMILTLALAIAAIAAPNINAQNVAAPKGASEQTQMQLNPNADTQRLMRDDSGRERLGKKDKKNKKNRKAPKGDKAFKGQRFMKGIQLSPEQQTQYNNLQTERREKAQKIRKEEREKLTKLSESYEKDLKKVLTPEQWAQYQNNKAAKGSRDKNFKGQRPGKREKGMHAQAHRQHSGKGMRGDAPRGRRPARDMQNAPANTQVSNGSVGQVQPGPVPVVETSK